MRCLPIILLVFFSGLASAQQSAASFEFFSTASECPSSLGGWKCLELDLSSEVSSETDSTKVFHYSWNLGDGKEIIGNKIDHCYEQFGSYQVSMDLIDAETNRVIRNELSSTVDLFPEIRPAILTRREDLPPSFIEFKCDFNGSDVFQPDDVYWRIDGKHYEGLVVTHPFHAAGAYQIDMAIVKNSELLGVMSACATTEITINDSEIWSSKVTKVIEAQRETANVGPFAKSEVFCLVMPRNPNIAPSVIPVRFLMDHAQIEEDGEYDVMLFSGNIFTGRMKFNAHGISGNDLRGALKDSITAFAARPLQWLKPLVFQEGSNLISREEPILKETVACLMQNPLLKIQIGAYIHSGSRIQHGIEMSLQRANLVKDLLISYGVASERIFVASPEYNRSLVNTCSAIPHCNGEDESLNGKVEFKIWGITYEP